MERFYRGESYENCQDEHFQKETDAKPGPQQHPTTRRASTKAFSPFKTKLFQSGTKETSNNRSRPLLKLSRLKTTPSKKKLLSKWVPKTSTGTGPTEAVKTGSFQKKLMPNGALSNMELPRRVLPTGAGPIEAHHQDGALPKINCCRNGSTTSNYQSEPLPKQSRRAPSEKKLLLTGTRQDPTTGAGLY